MMALPAWRLPFMGSLHVRGIELLAWHCIIVGLAWEIWTCMCVWDLGCLVLGV